jgi:2-polyprenyl-3-methyl-5-hydroxy-6-metoxy-1,4-benzoquinol methylase
MARSEIEHFRKKGPDKRDHMLAALVAARGVQGATVLEVGGGIGAIQIELLRAGAARTVDVDISEGYVAGARELAQSLSFGDVTEQRVLDFAHESGSLEPADVVVLNRVVCCYPDMPALVKPAAQHARRLLALTFPREAWWMKAGACVMNFGLWLFRKDFRFFVHPHEAIIALVTAGGSFQDSRTAVGTAGSRVPAGGLRPVVDRFSGVWRMMVFERSH